MDIYQLKLNVQFFNFIIFGDTSIDEDLRNTQYVNQDLAKLGVAGTIMVGSTLSSLTVATNKSDPDDSATLREVKVFVDESATRRDDAFYEKVMPIGAEGLSIVQVTESDTLPIVNEGEVFIPAPWVGSSTIQLIPPEGFVEGPEDVYVVEHLLVVVSPELLRP